MNILFVSTDYPKRGQPTSGLPNYLHRVSLSLLEMGHRPVILSVGSWESHRTEQGIEIWTVCARAYRHFQSGSIEYAVSALRTGYALNQKIRELLKKTQIDLIQFTSLYGIALLYHEKVPAVLRLSSYAKTAFSSYQTHAPKVVRTMTLFEIASARSCSAVFSPSEKNAAAFGKDCGRSVKVIETPFVNDVPEDDVRFYERNLKGKKYALFFGRLYAEKGISVIADCLEAFLERNPQYHFVFIGPADQINGEEATELLRRRAGRHVGRVFLSDALPHNQLYPVIKHADFVVLPSLMENLSNACIEAMYFRRVVIGTEGASFEQLITHAKSGLLCRIGDAQDLLEKMQMAVDMSEDEKREIERLAGERIARLRPEYAVKRLVKFYEYVIKNCGQG